MANLADNQFVPLTVGASAAVLHLSRNRFAFVDIPDWQAAVAFRWCYWCHDRQQSQYAIRVEYRNDRKRTIYLHRFIMGEPGSIVDHKDGDGLNCRRSNLRLASRSQNSQNRPKSKGAHPYKGVAYRKRRCPWSAHIRVEDRLMHLGSFTDPVAAAKAYDEAARQHFGPFAATNFQMDTSNG